MRVQLRVESAQWEPGWFKLCSPNYYKAKLGYRINTVFTSPCTLLCSVSVVIDLNILYPSLVDFYRSFKEGVGRRYPTESA